MRPLMARQSSSAAPPASASTVSGGYRATAEPSRPANSQQWASGWNRHRGAPSPTWPARARRQWNRAKVPSTRSDTVACVLAAIEARTRLTAGGRFPRPPVDKRAPQRVAHGSPTSQRRASRYSGSSGAATGRSLRPPLAQAAAVLGRRRCLGVPERVDAHGRVVDTLDTTAWAPSSVTRAGSSLPKNSTPLRSTCRSRTSTRATNSRLHDGSAHASRARPSRSHTGEPTWREFERAVTTIADAYLKPMLSGFVSQLQTALHASGVQRAAARLLSRMVAADG